MTFLSAIILFTSLRLTHNLNDKDDVNRNVKLLFFPDIIALVVKLGHVLVILKSHYRRLLYTVL